MNASTLASSELPRAESSEFHPLEFIPFFRRFPHSELRDVLYTVIFSALLAIVFTSVQVIIALGDPQPLTLKGVAIAFVKILAVSQIIGFVWHGVTHVASRWRAPWQWLISLSFWPSVGVWMLLGLGVTYLGFFLASLVPAFSFMAGFLTTPRAFVNALFISLLLSVLFSGLAEMHKRDRVVRESALAREASEQALQRQIAIAELKALQAQIEPHFLFNTLAHIASLIEREPARAKRMTEIFAAYAREQLASARAPVTTLDAEARLVEAYLKLMQVRMGERLRYAIAFAPALARSSLPPLLIQPLVENAIRHGLEPKIEGGRVALAASERDGALRIVIEDDGVGFKGSHSAGVGLANVRERLSRLYGNEASLTLEDVAPSGVRATITLPLTQYQPGEGARGVDSSVHRGLVRDRLGDRA